MEKRNVAFVTLARAGSKRIRNKNIAEINGKPLLQYTIDEVRKSKYFDETLSRNYIISSDSLEIGKLAKKSGIFFDQRPEHLASDTATSADALFYVAAKYLQGFKYIVEVMPTNPLKTVQDIDAVVDMMVENEHKSVISVSQLWDYHPARVKWIDCDGKLNDFIQEPLEARRQDLTPPAYIRNGSIYAMNMEWFLKNKLRYMPSVSVAYVMPPERTLNIDEPTDLELARLKIRNEHNIIIEDGFVV